MSKAKGKKQKPTDKKPGSSIGGGFASHWESMKIPKDLTMKIPKDLTMDDVDLLAGMLPGIASLYWWFVTGKALGVGPHAIVTVMLMTQGYDPSHIEPGSELHPVDFNPVTEIASFGKGTVKMISNGTIKGTIRVLRGLSVDWSDPVGVAFSENENVELVIHPLMNKVVLGSRVVTDIVSPAPWPYATESNVSAGEILCGRLVPEKKSNTAALGDALSRTYVMLSIVHDYLSGFRS